MNLKSFFTGFVAPKQSSSVEHTGFDRTLLDSAFNQLQDAVLSTTQLAANISVSLEEKLQLTEQKLSTILNALTDGVVLTDKEGNIIDWNGGVENIFGYTKEEAIGQNIGFIAGAGHEKYMARFFEKLASGEYESPVVQHVRSVKCMHKTGRDLELEISVNLLPATDGAGTNTFLAILRDVTERNKLGKERRDRQVMLDTIITSSQDVIIVKDAIGRWKLLNEAGKLLYGFTDSDYLNCTDDEIAYKFPTLADSLSICMDTDRTAWTARSATRSEEIVLDKHGKKMFYDVIKTPTFDRDGHRHELIITARNVTMLKEKRASVTIAHTALNASTDMVCITDNVGLVVFANKKLIQTYKFQDYYEIVGKKMSAVRHPETPDSMYKEMWSTINAGNMFQTTFMNRDLEGNDVKVFTTIMPIVDEELSTPYFICIQKVVD
jgi:PAS domain S-box-containing protein